MPHTIPATFWFEIDASLFVEMESVPAGRELHHLLTSNDFMPEVPQMLDPKTTEKSNKTDI
jgi:hypothetical protein